MDTLDLQDIGIILGGLGLFVVGLIIVAYARLYGPRLVRALLDRQPIIGIRYVEADDQAANRTAGMQPLVPGDMDAPEPTSIAGAHTSMILADEAAFVRHVAALKRPNGLHFLSANKLATAIGGNRNEVLALIREVRGDQTDEDAAPAPVGPVFIQSGAASWRRVGPDGKVL